MVKRIIVIVLVVAGLGIYFYPNPKYSYSADELMKKGYYIANRSQYKDANMEKVKTFISNVEQQKKDEIELVYYSIEGDPIFRQLNYNGKSIKVVTDYSADRYGNQGKIKRTCSGVKKIETDKDIKYLLNDCSGYVSGPDITVLPKEVKDTGDNR